MPALCRYWSHVSRERAARIGSRVAAAGRCESTGKRAADEVQARRCLDSRIMDSYRIAHRLAPCIETQHASIVGYQHTLNRPGFPGGSVIGMFQPHLLRTRVSGTASRNGEHSTSHWSVTLHRAMLQPHDRRTRRYPLPACDSDHKRRRASARTNHGGPTITSSLLDFQDSC